MDIHCRRCNEPWDIHGIPHSAGGYADDNDGDMTVQEGKKMMKGQGCPTCVNKRWRCVNCGEMLESLCAVCPNCGTEGGFKDMDDKDAHLKETLTDLLNHEDPESVLEKMGLY